VVELFDAPEGAVSSSPEGRVRRSTVDAADFGMPRVQIADLRGSDAATNAVIVGEVLAGGKGPHRDIVVFNAAAGLMVAGLANDLAAGIERAAAAIDDGSAMRVLQSLVHVSQECAQSA
jgi:anthranilate phosphoribosyltransferase